MFRKLLALALVLLCGGTLAVAQDFQTPIVTPTLFSPTYFKQAFLKPNKFTVEAPLPLRDMVQDGKLSLSIADVARLVVQRNTDVWLARFDVQNAQTAIVRAHAPFDPMFTGRFGTNRSTSPTYLQTNASTALNQQADFSYSQAFATGTAYQVDFGGTKYASNNAYQTLNPAIQTAMTVSLSQPLLRNRGFFIQRAPIVIAKINAQIQRSVFDQKLEDALQQALAQYWYTIQARENLAVLRNSLALAEKSYARDKRALELGALPPLDIFRSEAEVANRRIQVTTAEYQLRQQEDVLRRLISADIDPEVRNLPLNLTESPAPPDKLAEMNPEEAVAQALRARPELDALRRQQTIDETNIRVAVNSLKPDLRIGGLYSTNGLGGNSFDANGVPISGGFTDAMGDVLGLHNPSYGFQLSLSLPVKSRQAQADFAQAQIVRRKNLYQERNLTQTVTLDVKTALNRLEQAKANIASATVARDLAHKMLAAEQRKFELGAETIFFVLDAQQRASDADTQLLNAATSYRVALLSLQRSTATLLPEYNIVLEDALAAKSNTPAPRGNP